MSPDFVDFMVGSSGSGFWGGNPPTDLRVSSSVDGSLLTDPRVSGSVDGNPPPTVRLVGSGGDNSISGGSGWLIKSRGPVDTTTGILWGSVLVRLDKLPKSMFVAMIEFFFF